MFGIVIILFLVVIGYGILWYISNDRRVPAIRLPNVRRAVAFFPHPDDETLTCGGLLYDLARNGTQTHLIVLTKGERGVEGAHLTTSLKAVREQELMASAKALMVGNLYQHDLGDGEIVTRKSEVEKLVTHYLKTIRPDLVITYDRSGLYGHPDHMEVSNMVTQAVKQVPTMSLWYATRPRRVFRHIQLPVHMAKDPDFITLRTYPSFRMVISLGGLTAKVKSMYAHASQHFAFKKNRPWLPLWFYILTQTDEYFYEAQ